MAILPEQFSNHAGTTLNGAINNSVTSLVVTSASGLPSIPQFRVKLEDELMTVTAISGTTLTVTRGVEGTSAASHANGVNVDHVLTADAIERYRSNSLPIGTVEGRLTLVSGDPVPSADQSAKTTLYYTPYTGRRICLYDGTYWRSYYSAEISLSLSGAAGNYDVFVYYDSGTDTIKIEETAWTNDTTRASSIARTDGVWLKSSDTTRRYLGTIRHSASGQCSDTKTQRYVWNAYNRIERPLLVNDTGSSYTYNSTTIRQTRATSANKVEMVVGLQEALVYLEATQMETNTASSFFGIPGIGINATTTFDQDFYGRHGVNAIPGNTAILAHYPAVGYNYYSWNEKCANANTVTFLTYTADEYKTGLRGHIEA